MLQIQKDDGGEGIRCGEYVDDRSDQHHGGTNLHHGEKQANQRQKSGAWDADGEETETGEKRLNYSDAKNASGDASHCGLHELGVVRAPFAGEPRGDRARCLTPALSVRQKDTGDNDREHELQDVEAELGDRRHQPVAERRDLRPDLGQSGGQVHRGKPPEPLQRFADDWPAADALRRRRDR